MFRNLLCLLSVAIALAACASDSVPAGTHPGADLGKADPVKVEIKPDYRLNPGDVIQVEVFNQPTLNQTVQLDSTGAIALTLLGRVSAAGKTAFELSQQVRDGYAEKYLQNPQVAVLIKQQRVDTITVDGAVQQPGMFQIADKTSLIRAIALARGTDQLANPKQVVVFRNVNDERVAGVFDLTEIRKGASPDPVIYPNDVIVVATSGTRRTLRDIIGITPLVSFLPLIP